MPEYRMGRAEGRFARLVWEREPISSGALVSLCADALGWKKSTTYTVLRRLCERGILQNKDGTVSSLVSEEMFRGGQSEAVVREDFGGSLPQFVAAFTSRNKLTPDEVRELQRLIEESRGAEK